MSMERIELDGTITRHDTKATSKSGIQLLKVTVTLANTVGGDAVESQLGFVVRATPENIAKYPLDHALKITIGAPTK
jgi:hypothetical protein